MPRWPIRRKLLIGLSLVIGMMLTLLGGSIFGLRAFHQSNLTLTDQLRELGASKDLLQAVMELDLEDRELRLILDGPDQVEGLIEPVRAGELRRRFIERLENARRRLARYFNELERNSLQGNRADGREELALAFRIDDDLKRLLELVRPEVPAPYLIDHTPIYLRRHPEEDLNRAGPWRPLAIARARLNRLTASAVSLPDQLHADFFLVLDASKRHYQSSRIIVWSASLAVLVMLIGLTKLVHRWVLAPVRMLHRGVRHVAAGSFDYKVQLETGDEMQALAEAFNEMTDRLGASYAELEEQVAERSRQLVRSERLAGVGFLAAGVAHEINNPLASIAFCTEALESRLAPWLHRQSTEEADTNAEDSQVARDYLKLIQEEAFRCKRITERLLDFSRCGEIQRQPTDLAELIGGVVEMIHHMGKYRSKRIEFQPRQAVIAHVDPQEIKQVVLNLVVNALDCMEPNGLLRIETRVVGRYARLTFEDDGRGMSPEVLENIFEPFYTRRPDGKGTGLGLSITHRIICQHEGEIHATSPGEGLGSTFEVRLPIRPEAAPAKERPAPAANTEPPTPSNPDPQAETSRAEAPALVGEAARP